MTTALLYLATAVLVVACILKETKPMIMLYLADDPEHGSVGTSPVRAGEHFADIVGRLRDHALPADEREALLFERDALEDAYGAASLPTCSSGDGRPLAPSTLPRIVGRR